MQYLRRHLDDREIQRGWLDPRLSSLRVADVRSYLSRRGWKEWPSDTGEVVFEEPHLNPEGPLYQWLPASETRRDFVQAAYALLAAVAELENRYAGDILTEMLDAGEPERRAANGPSALSGKGAVHQG